MSVNLQIFLRDFMNYEYMAAAEKEKKAESIKIAIFLNFNKTRGKNTTHGGYHQEQKFTEQVKFWERWEQQKQRKLIK